MRRPQQDIINSSGRMRAAAEKLAAAEGGGLRVTVDLLIEHELRTIGIPKMRKDTKGGVRNLLWMQRALHFVFTLLKNVFEDMKEATPREAALDAYEKVLKPYHGETAGSSACLPTSATAEESLAVDMASAGEHSAR